MTSLSERLNGSEIDWPKLDWPADLPKFNFPDFDLPTLNLQKLNLPSLDLSALDWSNLELPNLASSENLTAIKSGLSDAISETRPQIQAKVQDLTEHLPEVQLPAQSALQDMLNAWTASALEWLGQLDDAIAAQAQTLLGQPIQQWVQTRLFALWPWILQHPLVAVLLLILGLVILLNFLQWLLNPKTWLAILSFPVRLIARWITPKPKGAVQKASTTSSATASTNTTASTNATASIQTTLTVEAEELLPGSLDQQKKVQEILARLKVLQTEQQQLHQQLESLLKSQSAPLP